MGTDFSRIPKEMRVLDRWVCVNSDSKAPMRSFEPVPASSTDPFTWSTFRAAQRSVEKGNYDWAGFVFSAGDGLVGIDIDNGFGTDGLPTDEACHLISTFDSYTEVSRSGRGFHIIVKGDLPGRGYHDGIGTEIYKDARYFIVTGNVVGPSEIREAQGAIDELLSTNFKINDSRASETSRGPRIYGPMYECPMANGKISMTPKWPPVLEGRRHLAMVSVAGRFHNRGMDDDRLFDEVMAVNREACKPPLNESEIRNIVSSVARYRTILL